MISLIADNLEPIRDLCRQHGIQRLNLFGSATTGAFDPETSDLDFIVDLGEYTSGTDFRYIDLIGDLESILGHSVHMITESSIRNDYFREAVDRQRVNLYEAGNRQQAA